MKYIISISMIAIGCGAQHTTTVEYHTETKVIEQQITPVTLPVLYHIVSTGQSNSIGGGGEPAISLHPPYDNLKVSPDNMTLQPLSEPVTGVQDRGETETHATAMASEITRRTGQRIIVSNSGEGGRNMAWISKGGGGQAYSHSIEAVARSVRYASEHNSKVIVPCVVLIHGESDSIEGASGDVYLAGLLRMQQDYDKDIRRLTGQSQTVQLLITLPGNDESKQAIRNAQILASEVSDYIKVVGTDAYFEWQEPSHKVHHTALGYRQLGHMIGKLISLDGDLK